MLNYKQLWQDALPLVIAFLAGLVTILTQYQAQAPYVALIVLIIDEVIYILKSQETTPSEPTPTPAPAPQPPAPPPIVFTLAASKTAAGISVNLSNGPANERYMLYDPDSNSLSIWHSLDANGADSWVAAGTAPIYEQLINEGATTFFAATEKSGKVTDNVTVK